ncbi:hypothetical protein ACOPJQ_07655 [Luteimonas dalianensis]|uniref:hypothetical protein n=1 Tax=Luteimonas dalianensis TaxID=1148196 RepID=UPI003BEF9D4E
MNSPRKPAEPDIRQAVLVADGGVQRLPVPEDPIRAWMELMEVVEALRPPGRPREARPTVGRFLI